MQAMDIRIINGQQRKASMKLNQYQTKEGGTRKSKSLNERLWLETNQEGQKAKRKIKQ